mmetsp:Transcript_2303/g.4803  ORF Transcript_2303/g.4803 Transcript_2303/m.4803 type:complete len:461 (-) Transcript_2303:124-1506(-)
MAEVMMRSVSSDAGWWSDSASSSCNFAGSSSFTSSFSTVATTASEAFGSEDRAFVEIPITAAVESSLCRRGRRRFRDLQANSVAKIRFDRPRRVLRVFGNEQEVESVRRQLECLGGQRKLVSTAVWCELMRNRCVEDAEKSTLHYFQKESGCRIHIERSHQEVRLFGPDECTAAAEQLIDNFALQCIELPLAVQDGLLPDETIQEITEACAVTLNVETEQLVLYGLQDAVNRAARSLLKHIEYTPMAPSNEEAALRARQSIRAYLGQPAPAAAAKEDVEAAVTDVDGDRLSPRASQDLSPDATPYGTTPYWSGALPGFGSLSSDMQEPAQMLQVEAPVQNIPAAPAMPAPTVPPPSLPPAPNHAPVQDVPVEGMMFPQPVAAVYGGVAPQQSMWPGPAVYQQSFTGYGADAGYQPMAMDYNNQSPGPVLASQPVYQTVFVPAASPGMMLASSSPIPVLSR